MAKCKLCKTDIPDGAEYCQDCQNKKNGKLNESYLDSLLNSVKNTSEPVETVYKKKNKESNHDNPAENVRKTSDNKKSSKSETTGRSEEQLESGLENDDLFRVDFSDIEDFDPISFDDDLKDMDSDIIISDEDLFGEEVSQLLSGADSNEEAVIAETEAETATTLDQDMSIALDEPEETIEDFSEPNDMTSEDAGEFFSGVLEEEEPHLSMVEDNIIPQEIEELPEDTGLDLDLDELLNSLDQSDPNVVEEKKQDIVHTDTEPSLSENINSPDEDMFHTFSEEEPIEEFNHTAEDHGLEALDSEDTDFLELLNQISGDDPMSDDLKAINHFVNNPDKDINIENMPGDIGEVFSDALTAVSSLKDFDSDEANSDIKEGASKAGRGKKTKQKKNKKAKGKKEKPTGNLFQRLFGNVKDGKTAAHFAEEMKQKEAEDTGVPGEKPKKEKGKKKGKKGTDAPAAEDAGGQGRKPGKDTEEEPAPVDKKAEKKKAKAEKKKAKQAIEVIDEINEDPGRINRMGAAIVFIFFGALASILILGTNIMSYTLNIQHAEDYFSKQKYTEAYYEVYGVELKDEDLELYEKIATVMFVNKQLNSYNNYYNIREYPQALDSLLKGLKRYDKYIELARMLGVESDLNYVREQILAELNKKFNLTEEEAVRLNTIPSMKDYSLAVYDVVFEKMNK